MKFFDFLQDVTLSAVFVALSLFLIDQPGQMKLANAATDDALPESVSETGLGLPTSADELPDDDALIAPSAGVESLSAESTTTAPASLDLDSLEQALSRQLGLQPFGGKTIGGETLSSPRENRSRPTPIIDEKPVDWRTGRPAPSSRPLNDVTRQFDERNLFDGARDRNAGFGVAPDNVWSHSRALPPSTPTRRVGPVEILETPSF